MEREDPNQVNSTSQNENEVANEIIVAPNPTNSFFSIKSFANSHLNLNIINLSGKRIMYIEGVKANEIIDISNLAAGVYFIEIAGEKIFERTRLIRN